MLDSCDTGDRDLSHTLDGEDAMTESHLNEAPIFDADTHMYETPEALTKYLPEKYKEAV